MPTNIILKKSGVANKVPLTTDLQLGELALNYADGKLYYKTSTNTISSISGAGGGAGTNTVTTSDTPPASPSNGQLWWDSLAGTLKIYYADQDSQQWVDASRAIYQQPAAQTTRVDQASASIIYRGYANAGSLETQAVWQIQKVTVVGETIQVQFADGNASYDNVWTDRATLTYS